MKIAKVNLSNVSGDQAGTLVILVFIIVFYLIARMLLFNRGYKDAMNQLNQDHMQEGKKTWKL